MNDFFLLASRVRSLRVENVCRMFLIYQKKIHMQNEMCAIFVIPSVYLIEERCFALSQ